MLVHFTSSYENIESILKDKGLLIKYCGEEFSNKNKRISSNAAHPMVSFSKFREDELLGRTISYGQYGIAFKSDWAIRSQVNPVIYMNNDSFASSGLEDLIEARRNTLNKLPSKLRLAIIKIKCFTKNAVGFNSWANKKDYKFYEENEWRFVPSKKQIGGNLISVNYSAYKKNKDKYNSRIARYKLPFEFDDIKWIYTSEDTIELLKESLPELAGKIKISTWQTSTFERSE